jgi:hypothetical protein
MAELDDDEPVTPQDNPDPGPNPHHGHTMGPGRAAGRSGARGYGHISGMEAALAAHADRVHPVKR